jgi:Domain of unknown function (DUF5911)
MCTFFAAAFLGRIMFMTSSIEDYGLIGDCETAALVSKDGSTDWLCWPRFDSGACFAALLGDANNGRWRIAPADSDVRITRRYRPNTLILETSFVTVDGEVMLIDFLPLRARAANLVRLVVGKRGTVRMSTELIIRFDYGASIPWVRRTHNGDLLAISGPDMLVLRTPVELRGERLTTVGEFAVSAGQTIPFVLMHAPSYLPAPDPVDAQDALRRTQTFWEEWAGAHRSTGMYADSVSRSLITLKALTYAPTGGIVAAPTSAIGCCEPLPGVLHRFRPCTDLLVRNGLLNGRSLGFWATKVRSRYGLATPPPISCRSTFLARSWMRCTRHVSAVFNISQKNGIFSVPFFPTLRRSGRLPTRASGKSAEDVGVSPIRG